MTNKLTPISEKDLNQIFNGRLKYDPNYLDQEIKYISYREINTDIDLEKKLILNTGVNISKLVFQNCTFNNLVKLGDYAAAGEIIFDTCIFKENVSFRSLVSTKIIGTCEFHKELTITIDSHEDKIISNLPHYSTLRIKGNVGKLSFGHLDVDKVIKDEKLIIEANCSQCDFDNIQFQELEFINPSKVQNMFIDNSNFSKLTLTRLELNSLLQLKNSHVQDINVIKIIGPNAEFKISDSSLIGTIKLPLGLFKKTDISDCEIGTLHCCESNGNENIISIQKVLFDNITFHKIHNSGLITLRELKISTLGILSIKSSNLGKTDFINCDFSKAILEFENSKLTEVFLSETDFPKQVKINGILNHPQAQLAFGQLNTAYQKQGDTIRSLEYQSREIEAHYNHLKNLSFDKINLWLNKWSNNFGRSWIRGILFTLIIAVVFFYCLAISTDEYEIGLAFDFKSEFVQPFLKFINPIRFFELENLFKKGESKPWLTLNWYSYVWDFLGRVFIAYGFYQTIQAFRKFGRR